MLFMVGAFRLVLARLDMIERLVRRVLNEEETMADVTGALDAKITDLGTALAGLTRLCDDQFAALQAAQANPDPAAIAADIERLEAQRQDVLGTIARDTPPAPPSPPDQPPV